MKQSAGSSVHAGRLRPRASRYVSLCSHKLLDAALIETAASMLFRTIWVVHTTDERIASSTAIEPARPTRNQVVQSRFLFPGRRTKLFITHTSLAEPMMAAALRAICFSKPLQSQG